MGSIHLDTNKHTQSPETAADRCISPCLKQSQGLAYQLKILIYAAPGQAGQVEAAAQASPVLSCNWAAVLQAVYWRQPSLRSP